VQHLQDPQMQGHWQMQIIRSWKERKYQGSGSFLSSPLHLIFGAKLVIDVQISAYGVV